jgi:hypothetical protein
MRPPNRWPANGLPKGDRRLSLFCACRQTPAVTSESSEPSGSALPPCDVALVCTATEHVLTHTQRKEHRQMESNIFDEVTKALATATSRREALRRIGGILGGTVLAGLFPGLAQADNSACAHFCNAVFGGDTPASAQCAKDASHKTGLCYTCGPASLGGTKPICCPQNPNGTCISYSSATCCSNVQMCQGGHCVTPTTVPPTTVPPTTVGPTTTTAFPTTTTAAPV